MTFEESMKREREVHIRRAICEALCKRRNQTKEQIAQMINAPVREILIPLRQLCEEGTLKATLYNDVAFGDEYYEYSIKG